MEKYIQESTNNVVKVNNYHELENSEVYKRRLIGQMQHILFTNEESYLQIA